uniref:Uncharacterized protein n=1 Tax=viral metagenome TaxID=1070528 RepID=A0A6M3LA14_9ZZZZ
MNDTALTLLKRLIPTIQDVGGYGYSFTEESYPIVHEIIEFLHKQYELENLYNDYECGLD